MASKPANSLSLNATPVFKVIGSAARPFKGRQKDFEAQSASTVQLDGWHASGFEKE